MPTPLIIGHRGDPSRSLENSLDAFRLALDIPVDMIEFDIRRSRDDVLYVMHDERTGRTCDKDIAIERSLSSEIAAVRLKNGEPVPTLADVLNLARGAAGLNIEIKSRGAGSILALALAGLRYRGFLLVSSFQEEEVKSFRKVLPDLPAARIFDLFTRRQAASYAKKGYSHISLSRRTVTKGLIDALHEQGVKVYVWTVDREREMRKFARWGVDGIYSNTPALLKKVLGRIA